MAPNPQVEIENPTRSTGYNLKLFIDPQSVEKFICPICKNVLRAAIQIPQSNDPKRACEVCYKENIRYVAAILTHFKFIFYRKRN